MGTFGIVGTSLCLQAGGVAGSSVLMWSRICIFEESLYPNFIRFAYAPYRRIICSKIDLTLQSIFPRNKALARQCPLGWYRVVGG